MGTIAPDRGEPRAGGTTPDELLHTALEHSRTPAHFGESKRVDSELMQFPLLHADVFIYKLDESFAMGSQYEDNAYTAKWSQTKYRLPGEDAISLATRVQNAYPRAADGTRFPATNHGARNPGGRISIGATREDSL